MNKYGLALTAPSTQTILPVMTTDGKVFGFYPIISRVFTGAETQHTTSDGAVVPLRTVTVDDYADIRNVKQYMAVVYDAGSYPWNSIPWASEDLVTADESGSYSFFSMPTETWVQRFSKGQLIQAIQTNMAPNVVVPSDGSNPTVEENAFTQTWQASVAYTSLTGDCSFFEFNWMAAFRGKNNSNSDPLRIRVLSNPVPGAYPVIPLKATVVGVPVATGNGVQYDTIRVTRMVPTLNPGTFAFVFSVTDTTDRSVTVTFNLTVL